MLSSYRLLLIFSLLLSSCLRNDRKKPAAFSPANKTNDTAQTQPVQESSDTIVIDKKAAVAFQPDSVQIEQRMKSTNEADFRAGMDDYLYSMHESWEFLEKQGITVIDAGSKKLLKFVFTDKSMQLIKTDTLEDLWGIYLFDPRKKPFYADITDMEEEYKKYYR